MRSSAPPRLRGRPWARIRRRILDRDGWRCARCRQPGRLEVHHVDRDRTNNAPENLETVCVSCHVAEHDERPDAVREWAQLVKELR